MQDLQTDLNPSLEMLTRAGEYRLIFDAEDMAGNILRVVMPYEIIPGPIDSARSMLNISGRNTHYADMQNFYSYQLLLKDEYQNPVEGREV
jgi:hypothetical protein